jgi:uncharacterized phosphosugar-binding protein
MIVRVAWSPEKVLITPDGAKLVAEVMEANPIIRVVNVGVLWVFGINLSWNALCGIFFRAGGLCY